MTFNRHDIYTTSGSVKLFNQWAPYVAKFDTSSFYNWEQDNLPLYDLEERTYEMWEQGGFPTSSITGFALTVSGNTPTNTLVADSTIFTTLSACLAAIPKVVRFPVLVEVCNFGDLGKLELHNIRIEEGGSIEIINRAYSKIFTTSGQIKAIVDEPASDKNYPLVTNLLAPDLSATLFSGNSDYVCTSAVHISTRVLQDSDVDGVDDTVSRLSSVYTFLYPDSYNRRSPLTVSVRNTKTEFMPTPATLYTFGLDPYENETTDASIAAGFDMSAVNPIDDTFVKRLDIAVDTSAGGSTYLNRCSKISVKDCDGPIYIRNFLVDGDNQTGMGAVLLRSPKRTGIEITNSDVLLENCAAIRCKEAGFKFNNSKVVLSRSAFAYRNYELSSSTGRFPDRGIGFHGVNSDISISALLTATTEAGAGEWEGEGRDVILCASRNNLGMRLDNSKLTGGLPRSVLTNSKTGGISTFELNNTFGIELNNSQVDLKGLLDVYGNLDGISLNNSQLVYEDLCVGGNQEKGLLSKNSSVMVDTSGNPGTTGQYRNKQTDFAHNGQHLDLQANSEFSFKKKVHIPTSYGNTAFLFAHGGLRWGETPNTLIPPAIQVDHSKANFLNTFIVPRLQSNFVPNTPHYGLALQANNNSNVEFYGTKNGATFIMGPPGYDYQRYVAGLYASKNSTIGLHGPTFIGQFGVDVLAEDNSVINITPPQLDSTNTIDVSGFDLSDVGNHTSVELHSTRSCLVANKNSTINLRDLGDYAGSWGNSPTGRILLADGTDYIVDADTREILRNGSLQFFPNPQNESAYTGFEMDDLSSTSRNLSYSQFAALGAGGTSPTFDVYTSSNQFAISVKSYYDDNTWEEKMAWMSKGGVCLRATEDSVVNVMNVNFPVGTSTSPMDSVFYSCSGTPCNLLMMWNIADTSRLNAAYCSVSAMYPYDVGYHGPSALWASAEVPGNNPVSPGAGRDIIASGAPSATPDTGVLSVLDTFGAGSGAWLIPSGVGFNEPFGRYYPVSGVDRGDAGTAAALEGILPLALVKRLVDAGIAVSGRGFMGHVDAGIYGAGVVNYDNQGVFRLYFSPKPETKLLYADMSGYINGACALGGHDFYGVAGPVYQIFSQCYNMSAPVSALASPDTTTWGEANATSSNYPNLLKLSYDSRGYGVADQLWTSGFYYCKEFVDDNPTQCMLDESASNLFANAKNASIGMSGRPRKVYLYRSRDSLDAGSEAFEGDASATIGFKSANIFDLKRDN